jgi:type II secretory pathway component PulF
MPLYKWYATDVKNTIEHGKQFARHPEQLEHIVAQRHLSLIAYTIISRPLSVTMLARERTAILSQLGTLLSAGVRVVDALETVTAATHHSYIKSILCDCRDALEEGISLSEVTQYHQELFPPLVYRMFAAGEQTGKLGLYCTKLAHDYALIDSFAQKIRSLLIMPCITFLAGISIFLLMLYAIVPRMGKLLSSIHGPLPRKTAFLLSLSEALRSPWGTSMLIMGILALIALFFFIRRSLTANIPLILLRGALFHDLSLAIFLRTLGLLLEGGIPLVDALQLAPWAPTEAYYRPLITHVVEGTSFSEAISTIISPIEPLCITLLRVGEATGKLGPMATECGAYYQQRVIRQCATLSKLVQPCILVILGILIALMMVALYEPMLTMGAAIS